MNHYITHKLANAEKLININHYNVKILKPAYDKKIKQMLLERKLHLKNCCISSRVFPFVSGTQMATNPTVKAHTSVYMVKVPNKNRKLLVNNK